MKLDRAATRQGGGGGRESSPGGGGGGGGLRQVAEQLMQGALTDASLASWSAPCTLAAISAMSLGSGTGTSLLGFSVSAAI